MIPHHFDACTRFLIERPKRREVLHAFVGIGIGLAATAGAPLVPRDTVARKKHGKQRNNHKKQRRNQAAPRPTADATCDPALWLWLGGSRRYAQTFRALRGGKLTSASFGLTYNIGSATFDLAIREIDPQGKPGYVLASTTISNVPATNLDAPPIENSPTRTVTGVFATPATVVAGQVYALTVTNVTGDRYSFDMQASPNSPCPDGVLFTDRNADGAFYPQTSWDLAFSTEVTA